MERLTYRGKTPNVVYCDYDIRAIINRLAEYEDLEEQELLIKLPCKVDDEFWVIAYKSDVITHVKCSGFTIIDDVPNRIKDSYVWIDSVDNPKNYWKISFNEFKTQCFKTKAEAALAKIKKGGVIMNETRRTETVVKEIMKELDFYMEKYPNTYGRVKKLLNEVIEIGKTKTEEALKQIGE